MFCSKYYLKQFNNKITFKQLIIIGSIFLMSLLTNNIFADQIKDTNIQRSKSLEQQINILKDKVDEVDKLGVTWNNNLTEQTMKALSISSDTVKYVGVISSIVLPLIILLIGYQVIRSYQFEREFRALRKQMLDEYEKILIIRSDAESITRQTKSEMGNIREFVGDLATNFLMSKASEWKCEEKEERDKIFEEVKTQVSEVKTTVEDEKARNIELMKKLESLDLTLTPTVYIERGSIYLDQGNYEKAVENFNEAIRLKGNESTAYSLRGKAYLRMKDHDNAIKDFTKLTKIEPKNSDAFVNLCICYIDKEDYESAMKNINKAIELSPKNSYAYYIKSHMYNRMGEYDSAINEVREAMNIHPNRYSYLSHIGLLYAKLGDFKNAINNYLKSIELLKTLHTMLNLAEAYICDGNYNEAEKLANDCYFKASKTYDKVFSKYLLLLALILGKKEYKLELKEFVKTVESNSDFSADGWSFEEISCCLKDKEKIPVQAATLIEKIISFLKREIKGEEILS